MSYLFYCFFRMLNICRHLLFQMKYTTKRCRKLYNRVESSDIFLQEPLMSIPGHGNQIADKIYAQL